MFHGFVPEHLDRFTLREVVAYQRECHRVIAAHNAAADPQEV